MFFFFFFFFFNSRALLFGGMLESQPGTKEIELQNTSAKAFDALQRYMYTGRMNLVEAKVNIIIYICSIYLSPTPQ